MRTVDLFAGCGGMSKGFQNAGFDIVAAFEYWNVAAQCYRDNFNHPVYEMDLSNTDEAIEAIRKFNPELIIGGPPCQDFSHAGKRIEADRASLTEAYATIVTTIKPTYFVMENVDRARNSNAFKVAKELFTNNGYGLTEIVLDASHCGVPQKRKRFFCIGVLNQSNDAVKTAIQKNISQHETTLRDYFGNSLDFEFYYRHPRNYSRRAVFSIDEPAPTMRGVNRPVPKGYPGHPNDACPVADNVRALTTNERALIQTFPTDFKWIGNKTDTEQMIGNAVPVKLAEYVANALKEYVSNQNQMATQKDRFISWLMTYKKYTKRSASDAISRVKRADKMYPIKDIPDSYYVYQLENIQDFNILSVTVKSQIKRATMLYADYLQTQAK